jgi:hypothetical protein
MANNYITDWAFDITDALRSPIVSPGGQVMNDRYRKLVPVARLKKLMKHETTATDIELALYLSEASLQAPLDGEHTDIFTHVSCNCEKEYFNRDMYDEVEAPRVLSSYLQGLKTSLANKIYNSRRKHLKEILKKNHKQKETVDRITVHIEEAKSNNVDMAAVVEKMLTTKMVQLNLF